MGDVSLTWQELARLPQQLNEVQAGVVALRPYVSTPRAAAATGSPPASVAISALGGLLVQFLADTARAIDDDVNALGGVAERYRSTEGAIAVSMRSRLEIVAATDDVVVPIAGAVTDVTDGVQSVARPAERHLRTVSSATTSAVHDALDGWVGREASGAVAAVVTAPYDIGAAVWSGVDGLSQAVEDGAGSATEAARDLAGRADRYLRVERPVRR